MAAVESVEAMENEVVRRAVVSSIARLCDNSPEPTKQLKIDQRNTLRENKNAL